MKIFISLFFILLTSLPAHAVDLDRWCDTIFKSTGVGCEDLTRSNSVGGSFPLLFDAFNVNASALPVNITPVGIEAFYDGQKPNFATLKGFDGFGLGASIAETEAVFFSEANNLRSALLRSELEDLTFGKYNRNINLGSSFALLGKKKSFLQLTGGASARYDQDTKSWSPAISASLKTSILTLGISKSESKSEENEIFPEQKHEITKYSAGLRLWNIYADFLHIRNEKSKTITTTIYSINYASGGLQLVYALRKQKDPYIDAGTRELFKSIGIDYQETHQLYGASYRYNEKLTFGLYRNYTLDSDISFLLQIVF